MEFQCELLVYLDKKGYTHNMRNKCLEFLEVLTEKTVRRILPLRYICSINAMELLDENADLGKILFAEPMKFLRMLDNILYSCLRTSGEHPLLEKVRESQVKVILRLLSVPELFISSNKHHYTGLVTFKGILTEVTKPINYAFHTVWCCPEECEGSEIVLPYLPDCAPKCYVCKSVLFENSSLRRCGEQVKAILTLENEFLPKILPVTDDLIPKLQLGNKYFLTGTVVKKRIYVLSIEQLQTLAAPLTAPIPCEINKLFNIFAEVPWKFISCLASMIGANVCPQSCFLHLKIYLLMSLVSVKSVSNGTNLIHVLVSGVDTGYVESLMTEAAELSDRSVFLGSGHNTSISTALISSAGGVCVMPLPLDMYSQKQVNFVRSAIESNEVPVESGAVKLNTSVWAQVTNFKKTSTLNASYVFGSLCRGDHGEYEDEIADFLLENTIEESHISEEIKHAYREIKMYLDLVAGFNVYLNDKAKKILGGYFVSARRVNPKSIGAGGMVTLTSVCAASAKLCRRGVASPEDAIFAVWLHASGTRGVPSMPEVYLEPPRDLEKFHEMMKQFKIWLEDFTDINLNTLKQIS